MFNLLLVIDNYGPCFNKLIGILMLIGIDSTFVCNQQFMLTV